MKQLKDLEIEKGTMTAQIIEDADGEIEYIKDIVNHGCSGGGCRGLVTYSQTHDFYAKHAEEIDEIIGNIANETGESPLKRVEGDLRNWLVWFAVEVRASEIIEALENEE